MATLNTSSSSSSSSVEDGGLHVHRLCDHLICHLCGGYLIDATVVVECLHTFCRSCILRHLQTSSLCPNIACNVIVHRTKASCSLRPDTLLQTLVYKMVPGLHQREMQRRRHFYSTLPEFSDWQLPPYCRGEDDPACPRFFSPDQQIDLRVQYASIHSDQIVPVRYLRCVAAMPVSVLKRFLSQKYQLSEDQSVTMDIIHGRRILPADLRLIDVCYLVNWNKRYLKLIFRLCRSTTSPYESKMTKRQRRSCVQRHSATLSVALPKSGQASNNSSNARSRLLSHPSRLSVLKSPKPVDKHKRKRCKTKRDTPMGVVSNDNRDEGSGGGSNSNGGGRGSCVGVSLIVADSVQSLLKQVHSYGNVVEDVNAKTSDSSCFHDSTASSSKIVSEIFKDRKVREVRQETETRGLNETGEKPVLDQDISYDVSVSETKNRLKVNGNCPRVAESPDTLNGNSPKMISKSDTTSAVCNNKETSEIAENVLSTRLNVADEKSFTDKVPSNAGNSIKVSLKSIRFKPRYSATNQTEKRSWKCVSIISPTSDPSSTYSASNCPAPGSTERSSNSSGDVSSPAPKYSDSARNSSSTPASVFGSSLKSCRTNVVTSKTKTVSDNKPSTFSSGVTTMNGPVKRPSSVVVSDSVVNPAKKRYVDSSVQTYLALKKPFNNDVKAPMLVPVSSQSTSISGHSGSVSVSKSESLPLLSTSPKTESNPCLKTFRAVSASTTTAYSKPPVSIVTVAPTSATTAMARSQIRTVSTNKIQSIVDTLVANKRLGLVKTTHNPSQSPAISVSTARSTYGTLAAVSSPSSLLLQCSSSSQLGTASTPTYLSPSISAASGRTSVKFGDSSSSTSSKPSQLVTPQCHLTDSRKGVSQPSQHAVSSSSSMSSCSAAESFSSVAHTSLSLSETLHVHTGESSLMFGNITGTYRPDVKSSGRLVFPVAPQLQQQRLPRSQSVRQIPNPSLLAQRNNSMYPTTSTPNVGRTHSDTASSEVLAVKKASPTAGATASPDLAVTPTSGHSSAAATASVFSAAAVTAAATAGVIGSPITTGRILDPAIYSLERQLNEAGTTITLTKAATAAVSD